MKDDSLILKGFFAILYLIFTYHHKSPDIWRFTLIGHVHQTIEFTSTYIKLTAQWKHNFVLLFMNDNFVQFCETFFHCINQ